MDIYKVLALLEKLESVFSGLYKKLHEDFQQDKAAAEFFFNMHMDEESHLQIVRMEQRIVRASPKVFKEPQINLSEINALFDNIEQLKSTKLSLPEVIERIYILEHSSAVSYFIDAIQDTNEDLKQFLLSLGDTCAAHREKVESFARSLGVAIKEIPDATARKARVGFSDNVIINASLTVRGVDISEGGMFLLTGRSFPTGDALSLRFAILQSPVTVKAVVQFNIPSVGMGVNFTDLSDNDKDLIAVYVEQRIHEKGLEKDRRVLLVGGSDPNAHDMRIYMNGLLGEGYKAVDISGFEDTVNALRKGISLSCIVIACETALDTNYYILHYISTLDNYKDLPVLVLLNSQDKQFREKLIKKGRIKLLSRITTSPKRLIDEVRTLIG